MKDLFDSPADPDVCSVRAAGQPIEQAEGSDPAGGRNGDPPARSAGAPGADAATDEAAGTELGKLRRDRALLHHLVWNGANVQRAAIVFLRALLRDGPATTDAVYRDWPDIPRRALWLGTAARMLAEAGIIEKTGRCTPSCRPEAHGRDLAVWHVVDEPAGRAWLAVRDPQPDVDPGAPGPPGEVVHVASPDGAPRSGAPPNGQKNGPSVAPDGTGLANVHRQQSTPDAPDPQSSCAAGGSPLRPGGNGDQVSDDAEPIAAGSDSAGGSQHGG